MRRTVSTLALGALMVTAGASLAEAAPAGLSGHFVAGGSAHTVAAPTPHTGGMRNGGATGANGAMGNTGHMAGAAPNAMHSGRSVGFDRRGRIYGYGGFGGTGFYGDGFGNGVGALGGYDDLDTTNCDLLQYKEGLCAYLN